MLNVSMASLRRLCAMLLLVALALADSLAGPAVPFPEGRPPSSTPTPQTHPPDILAFKLTASDGAALDNFGTAVSGSGDVMLVGAPNEDDQGENAGAAYVFRWTGSGWTEEAKLTAAGAAAFDSFGQAVALSGDVAVIGAPRDDHTDADAGAAYAFRWDGSGWVEEARLTASDGVANDRFGEAVAVSGDVAALYAERKGAVYLYRRTGSAWVEEAQRSADQFSASLALSGDVLLIGSRNAGTTQVYRWNGTSWMQEAVLSPGDGQVGDGFGASVALSGDVALVGASSHGITHGAAYVYRWNGTAWLEETELAASDRRAMAFFGMDVALGGDIAVAGSRAHRLEAGRPGQAYVFRWNGARWQEVAHPNATDLVPFSDFGEAVAVGNNHVFVAASDDDDNGTRAGAVYAYTIPFDDLPALAVSRRRLFATPVQGTVHADTLTIRNGGTQNLEWSISTTSAGWLRTDVPFGLLSPGDSSWVRVDVDATDLAVGPYNGTLTLTTNDPDDAVFEVPVFAQVHADTLAEVKRTGSDTGPGDRFGESLAMDGDRAIVGAPAHNDGDGAAYVLRWNNTEWVEEARLIPAGATSLFGKAVAISGDVVVVGTQQYVGAFPSFEVYVYRRDGPAWIEEARLISDKALVEGDYFGRAVAVSGDVILVGAQQDDFRRGRVYVYRWDGQAWSQEAALAATDASVFGYFGVSVALRDSLALVGAHSGAYVFRRDSTGWFEEAKLTIDGTGLFGPPVALSDAVALVGAPADEERGFEAGAALVFRRDSTGWFEEAKLLPSDGFARDAFGLAVALSGSKALIGAQFHPHVDGPGAVYVFDATGGAWTQWAKLTASDGRQTVHEWEDLDFFGASVALSDTLALVGASAEATRGAFAGAVYGYDIGSVPKAVQRYYYLVDHLGSVRATVNEAGTVVHYDDYYPYGLRMPGRSMATPEAPRERFTGKERDGESGLYYFGARYYDAEIARWTSVDPLAEKHPDWTPYNYVLGNPLGLVDPDGRQVAAEVYQNARVTSETGVEMRFPRPDPIVDLATAANVSQEVGVMAASMLAEPIDWGLTAYDGYQNGVNWTHFASLLPIVSSAAFRTGRNVLEAGGNVARAADNVFGISRGRLKNLGINTADVRIIAGRSDKLAIIGQGQVRVRGLAQEIGANAETFIPSGVAKSELRKLRKVYSGNIPPEILKSTIAFTENQKWIRDVKSQGYTFVDIGSQPGAGSSVFYELEKEITYGVGN